MARYRYRGTYPPYVSVAQKRARARGKLAALGKKNADIRPVCLQGATLARTWWGKAWNRNLERYADYENRIGRGRSYVRHGAVLDLRIQPGEVQALVQGSRSAPYRVSIRIRRFDTKLWRSIRETCAGRLGSLSDLLAGKLPGDLEELFTEKGKGLFPSPKEISFSCSCPDWASMCKHVAAALYGVGARLDEEPHLFFTLRDLSVESLISEVVAAKTTEMIRRAGRKGSRVLEDAQIASVFGIEMEEGPVGGPGENSPREEKTPVSKAAGKKAAPAVRARGRKVRADQGGRFRKVGPGVFALAETPEKVSERDGLLAAIQATTGAFRIAELQERCPGASAQQIRRVLGRLRESGQVECLGRGRGARWRRTGKR